MPEPTTKERIVNAARSLLDQHGWFEVTRQAVAQEAGVTTATVGNYFYNMRIVALAAYQPELQAIVKRTETKLSRGSDAASKVLSELILELAMVLDGKLALANALQATANESPLCTRKVRKGETGLVGFEQLAELVSRLVEAHWNGARPNDCPKEVAEYCLSGMFGWALRHPRRSEWDVARLTLGRLLSTPPA